MKIGPQIQFPSKKWRETKKGKNKIKNNSIKIWKDNNHHKTGPSQNRENLDFFKKKKLREWGKDIVLFFSSF